MKKAILAGAKNKELHKTKSRKGRKGSVSPFQGPKHTNQKST